MSEHRLQNPTAPALDDGVVVYYASPNHNRGPYRRLVGANWEEVMKTTMFIEVVSDDDDGCVAARTAVSSSLKSPCSTRAYPSSPVG